MSRECHLPVPPHASGFIVVDFLLPSTALPLMDQMFLWVWGEISYPEMRGFHKWGIPNSWLVYNGKFQ
jgi:hypothetical protein